jgi:hypothetical protein
MTGPTRPLQANRPDGPRGRHEISVAMLAAGHETGWWDDHGNPAPWPADFHHPDSGWQLGGHTHHDHQPNGDQPPF